jgi:hypothetical protein
MAGNGRSGEGVLLAALAAGASYVDAAKQAGVHERTVRRRMDDPDFRRQVDQLRGEVVARAVAMLSSASVEAVETLRRLLGSEMDFARLAAARSILELGAKYREAEDLAVRLEVLEQRLAEQQPSMRGGRP